MERALSPFLCKDLIYLCYPLAYDVSSAARAGDLEALQYLILQKGGLQESSEILKVAEEALRGPIDEKSPCNSSKLEIVKWLKKDLRRMSYEDVRSFIRSVARETRELSWIRFLEQTFAFSKWESEHMLYIVFAIQAAIHGEVDVLKLLVEEGKIKDEHTFAYILCEATEKGHLEVVKWVSDYCHPNAKGLKYDVGVSHQAAVIKGHLGVIQWYWSRFNYGCDSITLCKAVLSGQLELAKWIKVTFNLIIGSSVYCSAIKGGSVELLKWIKEINPSVSVADCPNETYCVNHAAEHGTSTLEWLRLNDPSALGYLSGSVYDRASFGWNLNTMMWVRTHFPHLRPSCAVRRAKVRNDEPMLKWLSENFPEGDTHENWVMYEDDYYYAMKCI